MAKVMDSIANVSLAVFAVMMLIANTVIMTPFDLRRVLIYAPLAVFGAMPALSTKPRVQMMAPVLVALTMVLVIFCLVGEERHRLKMKGWADATTARQIREAVEAAKEEARREAIAGARKASVGITEEPQR